MEEETKVNQAWDRPDSRDYTFENFIKVKEQLEIAAAPQYPVKRPRDEVIVQNQLQTDGCTFFGAIHIHNWLNILEDREYGATRKQTDAMEVWNAFCRWRWHTKWWASIQDAANRLRKNNYISWYVTIPNSTPLDKMVLQMKQAIDMWWFMYWGSAYGNWSKIRQTWVYEESDPKVFLWHWYGTATDYVLNADGSVNYFRAINSYGEKRWPYNGYFKIYAKDVWKLYSKLIFIDFDDKVVFAKLQEIEKIKQAVKLFREVYPIADKQVQVYLENIKLWENLSKLYNTTI